MTIFMHEFYFSIVLIFRAVTGLGPPPGSALKPNVELELLESDLTEELQDSGTYIDLHLHAFFFFYRQFAIFQL